jgi:hypothetical protein
MYITITSIIKHDPDEILVEYSTPYGGGISKFMGTPPKENQKYDVELNIDDDFFWGENLTLSKKNAPSILFNSGKTYITAELIAIEDDGGGVLKIGDSILLISIKNKNHVLPAFVDIISQDISLHPTNI